MQQTKLSTLIVEIGSGDVQILLNPNLEDLNKVSSKHLVANLSESDNFKLIPLDNFRDKDLIVIKTLQPMSEVVVSFLSQDQLIVLSNTPQIGTLRNLKDY